ncbi:MAG: cytochrome c oxidase subunit II, partial [Gammaproteobacteria bacterium]
MRRVQSTLFALLAASSAAYADTTLNLTSGVSPISHDIYQLHMAVFWLCVIIGIGVFGTMFYSIVHHRKSKGFKPAQFHSYPWLEITWTIIPAVILILMAVPATKVLLNMNNYDKDELTIKVTGYQWKWRYEYMEDGITFFSNLSTPIEQMHNQVPKGPDYLREVDHPLVIPIHKKVRFLVTSNDVNHAWWVPDFGIKRDAISGFINEAWTIVDKPGIYRGQCAELCGINHAFMPIVVIATTEQGYKDWVAQQKGQATQGEADVNKEWTMQELMKQGEQVYTRICAACHQPNGAGLPPTFPALKGSKVATGPIANHVNTVFNGVSSTAMQAFKNQLSDVELASVITYERNAFGNNTGTLVQPIQIKALRDGKSITDALATNATSAAKAVSTPAPAAAAKPAASPADELKAAMVRGEKVYMGTCAVCHQPTGLGMPPTFPALKGSAIATGPVAGHIHQVMNGKPGTAMQAFKDQFSDQELADVIT